MGGDLAVKGNNQYCIGAHVSNVNDSFGAGVDAGFRKENEKNNYNLNLCGTTYSNGSSKVDATLNIGRNHNIENYNPFTFKHGYQVRYQNTTSPLNMSYDVNGRIYSIRNEKLNNKTIQLNFRPGIEYETRNRKFSGETGLIFGANIPVGGKTSIERTYKNPNETVVLSGSRKDPTLNLGAFVDASYHLNDRVDLNLKGELLANPEISLGIRYTL